MCVSHLMTPTWSAVSPETLVLAARLLLTPLCSANSRVRHAYSPGVLKLVFE